MSIYSVTRRATPDEMGREIDRRGECIKKLETEIERLRAALRPFANFCIDIDATEAGRLAPASQMIHAGLTVGAFRDARAALEKQ